MRQPNDGHDGHDGQIERQTVRRTEIPAIEAHHESFETKRRPSGFSASVCSLLQSQPLTNRCGQHSATTPPKAILPIVVTRNELRNVLDKCKQVLFSNRFLLNSLWP